MTSVTPHAPQGDSALRAAARQLEARFLAEMLKPAGLAEPRGGLGGGAGEGQFASFLREAYAEAMTHAGGIGLAEPIFEALKQRGGGDG